MFTWWWKAFAAILFLLMVLWTVRITSIPKEQVCIHELMQTTGGTVVPPPDVLEESQPKPEAEGR